MWAGGQWQGQGYDAAGNMTNDNLGNGYTYDGASRIAQVNGSVVIYSYGPASGERGGVSQGCQLICTPEFHQFLHDTGARPGDGSAPQQQFTVNVNASANGPVHGGAITPSPSIAPPPSGPSFFERLVYSTLGPI